MKRATREWVSKAEGDWKVAQREIKEADPVWDAVAFHAQQCAEKYLKAFLEEQGVPFTKSHNLLKTLDLSQGLLAELDGSRTQLTHLSVFGIAVRYPSVQADQEAAEQAVRIAGQVRNVVRAKLGLP